MLRTEYQMPMRKKGVLTASNNSGSQQCILILKLLGFFAGIIYEKNAVTVWPHQRRKGS